MDTAKSGLLPGNPQSGCKIIYRGNPRNPPQAPHSFSARKRLTKSIRTAVKAHIPGKDHCCLCMIRMLLQVGQNPFAPIFRDGFSGDDISHCLQHTLRAKDHRHPGKRTNRLHGHLSAASHADANQKKLSSLIRCVRLFLQRLCRQS